MPKTLGCAASTYHFKVRIRHPTTVVVTKTELRVHRLALTNHLHFFCYLFYLDMKLRKYFNQNESEFLLQETKAQNFIQIPPENFDNGLNNTSAVILVNRIMYIAARIWIGLTCTDRWLRILTVSQEITRFATHS